MPEVFRSSSPALTSLYGLPRGVAGRRAAIKFIMDEDNSSNNKNGVLYFADDDNTYDSRLFGELRKTVNVSMFPVGLLRPAGFR